MKNEEKGIKRIINAHRFSWQGLRRCYQSEAAFRQELWASMVLIPLGIYIGDSAVERVLLIFPIFLILIVEVLNTAIESVVDRIGNDYHLLSEAAKDMGSAAVWLSILLLVITWLIILV